MVDARPVNGIATVMVVSSDESLHRYVALKQCKHLLIDSNRRRHVSTVRIYAN